MNNRNNAFYTVAGHNGLLRGRAWQRSAKRQAERGTRKVIVIHFLYHIILFREIFHTMAPVLTGKYIAAMTLTSAT